MATSTSGYLRARSSPAASAEAAGDVELLNKKVKREMDWVVGEGHRIRSYLAEQLLGDLNEGWRGSKEFPVTREEPVRRLRPLMITVMPDGSVIVAFDDDRLFLGHWVVAEFDVEHQPVRAYLEG